MTNSTETYWDVDGVSLQTLAQNIVTLGGDRMGVPPVRGSNLNVPHKPGSVWMPKELDERTISLGMWVQGCNPDGSIPPSTRRVFEKNWRALQRLLFTPRRQFTLTKRFWVDEDELSGLDFSGLPADGYGNRLVTASAKASYGGGLTPTMNGQRSAAFTVDLVLTDPYFYSAPITQSFGSGNHVFDVVGDDRTYKIVAKLNGDFTGATLTNTTEQVWVEYNAFSTPVASGTYITLDVDAFRAALASGAKAPGQVTHDGDPHWLFLEPGQANLLLSISGGGSVDVTYQPAWF